MPLPQANEFRKKWKTPPRLFFTPEKRVKNIGATSPSQNLTNRFQDTEKGLECDGRYSTNTALTNFFSIIHYIDTHYFIRNLAEECQIAWKEYWPFLNDFADLRKVDGLTKFEKYLNKKYKELSFSYNNVILSIYISVVFHLIADYLYSSQKIINRDKALDGIDTDNEGQKNPMTISLEDNFKEKINLNSKIEENPPNDFDSMCNRLHSLTITNCNLVEDDTGNSKQSVIHFQLFTLRFDIWILVNFS